MRIVVEKEDFENAATRKITITGPNKEAVEEAKEEVNLQKVHIPVEAD